MAILAATGSTLEPVVGEHLICDHIRCDLLGESGLQQIGNGSQKFLLRIRIDNHPGILMLTGCQLDDREEISASSVFRSAKAIGINKS